MYSLNVLWVILRVKGFVYGPLHVLGTEEIMRSFVISVFWIRIRADVDKPFGGQEPDRLSNLMFAIHAIDSGFEVCSGARLPKAHVAWRRLAVPLGRGSLMFRLWAVFQ
jgi:hypothetical protein